MLLLLGISHKSLRKYFSEFSCMLLFVQRLVRKSNAYVLQNIARRNISETAVAGRNIQFSTISESSDSGGGSDNIDFATNKSWNEEWKAIGLGARLPKPGSKMTNLLFVQTGFGVDQHGDRQKDGGTKAAVRAVRDAIEFNSIPGMMEAVPGGRKEMLIHVKLGVPPKEDGGNMPIPVDLSEIAKVFPYGRLMPIDVVVGGLLFPTGRVVKELGDVDDVAICVAACISIGYDIADKKKPS